MTAKHIVLSIQKQSNILARLIRAYTDNGLNVLTAEIDTSDYTFSDCISCTVLHNFFFTVENPRRSFISFTSYL